MSELHIPDGAREAATAAIHIADAESFWRYASAGKSAAVALAAAAPLIVAAELRRLADAYDEPARKERQRANRLANGAPKWQYEAAITSYQELAGFARRLRARADELDGGTR